MYFNFAKCVTNCDLLSYLELDKNYPSSMACAIVSGSSLFNVSGKNKANIPAISDDTPIA